MAERRVLILGNLKGAEQAEIESACRELSATAVMAPRADGAIEHLLSGSWSAVLTDMTTPGAARFCQELRAERRRHGLPMLGLSPKLTDLTFTNAFRWGVDDVVEINAEAITRRVAGLLNSPATATTPTRGTAVIADADRCRGDVLGRVLENAGYSIKLAPDATATRFYTGNNDIKIILVRHELTPTVELIESAQADGCRAQWIVLTKQREFEAARGAHAHLPGVITISSHGPPENVLFGLNLLNPSPDSTRRLYARDLHGVTVLFRSAGSEEDDYGFSYSVSPNGIYVRTLVPAPTDRVWLELRPQSSDRRVRLVGEVVWSRAFGKRGGEVAPPGFGLRITGGLGEDLRLWMDGFVAPGDKAPEPTDNGNGLAGSFRVPMPGRQLGGAPRASFLPGSYSKPAFRASSPSARAVDAESSALGSNGATSEASERARRPTVLSRPPGNRGRDSGVALGPQAPPATPPESPLAPRGESMRPVRAKVKASVSQAPIVFPLMPEALPEPTDAQQSAPEAKERAKLWGGAKDSPVSPAATVPQASPATESRKTLALVDLTQAAPPPKPRSVSDLAPLKPQDSKSVGPLGAAARNSQRPSLLSPPKKPAISVAPRSTPSLSGVGSELEVHDPDKKMTPLPTISIAAGGVTEDAAPSEGEDRKRITEPAPGSPAPDLTADDDETGPPTERSSAISLVAPDTAHLRQADTSELGTDSVQPDLTAPSASTSEDPPTESGRRSNLEASPQPARNDEGSSDAADSDPGDGETSLPPEARTSDREALPAARDEPKETDDGREQSLDATLLAENRHASGRVDKERTPARPQSSDPISSVPVPSEDQSGLGRWLLVAAVTALGGFLIFNELRSPLDPARTAEDPRHPDSLAEGQDRSPPASVPPIVAPTTAGLPSRLRLPAPLHSAPAASLSAPHAPVASTELGGADAPSSTPPRPAAGPTALPAGAPPPLDALGGHEGWLLVRSRLRTNVFVHGKDAGRTNTWLRVRCGSRYIRLGSKPAHWESDGLPARLRCRGTTVLTLEP